MKPDCMQTTKSWNRDHESPSSRNGDSPCNNIVSSLKGTLHRQVCLVNITVVLFDLYTLHSYL